MEAMEYQLSNKQKIYIPIKRIIDIILSGSAIVLLSPIFCIISLVIKLESPGPVLFKQKRIGKGGELFEIWKFRSMRIDTPKDIPTHMLNDPDQYITEFGKFIRRTSLDELPQIFNIFRGQMSIIGPRPALWNQYDLFRERDKYGANSIKPGLTGWAQINGRDELEIPVKAKFDGEYLEKMGLWMDVKCFLGTIGSVLSSDGVIEGGTSEMKEVETGTKRVDKVKKEIGTGTIVFFSIVILIKCLREDIDDLYKKHMNIKYAVGCAVMAFMSSVLYKQNKCREEIYKGLLDGSSGDCMTHNEKDEKVPSCVKHVLITGTGSYIGVSVENWLMKQPEKYEVTTIDMRTDTWKKKDFSYYDVIYHVAGLAHADIGVVTEKQKQMYYKVNTELAVKVAKKAKESGVKQFIFMSSMIVYSGCKEKMITRNTIPSPLNYYGDSKWKADQRIRAMESDNFKVVVLRPPMIYGKGSKGNYPKLVKIASHYPIFPIVKNERSMLYIDNLCEFVRLMIDNEESGVFFPQNASYSNTSDMVQIIAIVKGHKILMIPGMTNLIKILSMVPGKIGELTKKAFGDFAYDMKMSQYKENYCVLGLLDSIKAAEGER